MKKNVSSDGILVFDRYYTKKPVPALLIARRAVFCALLSAAAMCFVFSQFAFQSVSLAFVAAVSALSAAALLLLFAFFGRRFVAPALLGAGAVFVFFNFGAIWQRFQYFVDEAMLLVDGRFLFPRGYLLHDEALLTPDNPLYADGMLLGSALICVLYSFLCAFSMKRRVRVMPPLLGFIALCVPRLLSETLEFNLWFAAAALMLAAAAAIELNYRSGLAVTMRGELYRAQAREEERSFNTAASKAKLPKRMAMRASYYSKYAASGALCAAVFAASLAVAANIFPQGSSLDYTQLYDMLFAASGGSDSGTVSDYLTEHNEDSGNLNITNPGKGDKSIIRVSYTGDSDIYLRGDIGVNFLGTGWTTPASDNELWESSGLAAAYRPAEPQVMNIILNALGIRNVGGVSISEITIDYLYETDVVFLPSAPVDFSFYDSDRFDVYGDFCVRVSENAGSYINSVQCAAVSHDFSSDAGTSAEDVVSHIISCYSDNHITIDDIYNKIINDMDGAVESDGCLFWHYGRYVEDAYLGVPDYLELQLAEFMERQGIEDKIANKDGGESLYRYSAAAAICDFLSENYTYSLSGENTGDDALMQFLTVTHSGHCSLYATAMTLMLRELGVPARYCTGFSIYPDSVGGSTVVLKERNLHAWVEVYIDELGWVTFDPTSAAVSSSVSYTTEKPESSAPESKPDEPVESVEEKENPPQESKPDTSDNPSAEESKPAVPPYVFVIIAFAAVAAALLAFVIYKYNSARKNAECALDGGCTDVSAAYGCIVDMLCLFGLKIQNGQLPSDYYLACDKALGTSLYGSADVLEKAAFGSGELAPQENETLCTALRGTYNCAVKRARPMLRYRIRKLVVKLVK